jgi:hypothetical protein
MAPQTIEMAQNGLANGKARKAAGLDDPAADRQAELT